MTHNQPRLRRLLCCSTTNRYPGQAASYKQRLLQNQATGRHLNSMAKQAYDRRQACAPCQRRLGRPYLLCAKCPLQAFHTPSTTPPCWLEPQTNRKEQGNCTRFTHTTHNTLASAVLKGSPNLSPSCRVPWLNPARFRATRHPPPPTKTLPPHPRSAADCCCCWLLLPQQSHCCRLLHWS